MRSEIDEMKEKMDLLQNQEVYAAPGHTAMLSHTVHEHNREEEVTEGEILPLETIEETQNLSLNSLEKELIAKVLQKNKGHRKATAKELGIAERTLYRKIKEYEIE